MGKDSSVQIESIGSAEKAASVVEKTDVYNPHVDVSGVDERKFMKKIDFVLLPWLSFLYLLSFLDRTSIGK